MQGAPALGTHTARAFAYARLAGVSRELVPEECTQLCLARARAELPGSWHRHKRPCHLKFIEVQESPCSSQSFGCHDQFGTSLIMDCKVGLCSRFLTSS
jgi:hypothetical protein